MKQSLIFAFLVLIVFSCDFNDMPEPRDETQKWALAGYQVEVSGDLEYTNIQDSAYVYSLLPDGSFSKKVGEYELKGTYEESFSDGLKRYKFMYTSKNSLLIHSCATSTEDYFINSKGQLTGTWDACEGPKLYFNKQN